MLRSEQGSQGEIPPQPTRKPLRAKTRTIPALSSNRELPRHLRQLGSGLPSTREHIQQWLHDEQASGGTGKLSLKPAKTWPSEPLPSPLRRGPQGSLSHIGTFCLGLDWIVGSKISNECAT